MSFVAGYNASASGGAISTIDFTAQALIGGTNTGGNPINANPPTAVVTDTNFATTLEGLNPAGGTMPNGNAYSVGGANNNQISITSTDSDNDVIVSTYTAYTSYNTTTGVNVPATTIAAPTAATPTGANVWTVQTVATAAPGGSPGGLLIQTGQSALQGTWNLTNLGVAGPGGTPGTQVTGANASDMLSAVTQALDAVKNYASSIGSAQDADDARRPISTRR